MAEQICLYLDRLLGAKHGDITHDSNPVDYMDSYDHVYKIVKYAITYAATLKTNLDLVALKQIISESKHGIDNYNYDLLQLELEELECVAGGG